MCKKRRNYIKHAILRAKERYDSFLSEKDLGNINQQILDPARNKAELIADGLPVNRSLWIVTLPDGRTAYTIFDPMVKTVVTFLTHEMAYKCL